MEFGARRGNKADREKASTSMHMTPENLQAVA